MARPEHGTLVMQSLLDRLVDREDWPATRAQSARMFRDGLRRDLEWLLNTRQTPVPAEGYENASRSVYNFGVPDLSMTSAASEQDRTRIARALEAAIRLYEPRIANPRVTVEDGGADTRRLRFRIEGMMRIDPQPEEVCFDTVLELGRGEYEIR